jgi:hypothetical protein
MEAERLLKKLDRRLEQVEQILPMLPTRDEMKDATGRAVEPLVTQAQMKAVIAEAIAPLATKEKLVAAIAPLATKDELAAAIAPLATKDELSQEGERTRQHFDVVAEGLRDDIRHLAEHHVAFQAEVRRGFKDVGKRLNDHEKRITRLEARHGKRGGATKRNGT